MPSKKRTNKRKLRKSLKTRRRKQKGGASIPPPADPILPEDILFQDADVCILKPDVKKGILIFTNYTQPAGMTPLCEAGLKTGFQLQSEGVKFGRTIFHRYIFFRAPYFSHPIDYTSIDTEIESSFGSENSAVSFRVWIRIDPEKSNVYSSEIRAKFSPQFRFGTPEYLSAIENEVEKSKKSMKEYLRILDENEKAIAGIEPGKKALYNLYSSKVSVVPTAYISMYPLDTHNINRQSEVLVRIPHLTPNYFVKCS